MRSPDPPLVDSRPWRSPRGLATRPSSAAPRHRPHRRRSPCHCRLLRARPLPPSRIVASFTSRSIPWRRAVAFSPMTEAPTPGRTRRKRRRTLGAALSASVARPRIPKNASTGYIRHRGPDCAAPEAEPEVGQALGCGPRLRLDGDVNDDRIGTPDETGRRTPDIDAADETSDRQLQRQVAASAFRLQVQLHRTVASLRNEPC